MRAGTRSATARTAGSSRRPRSNESAGLGPARSPRRAAYMNRALEPFAQGFESRPPRVGRRLVVRVRLVVQVLAADRAETGALRAAEDLVRQCQRDCIAGPGDEVEAVVLKVLRPQLLRVSGVRRLVLARVDRQLEDGVFEAAEARTVQARGEPELEDGAGRRLRDHEFRRHLLRHRKVALATELERLELELDLVAVILAGPELDAPETEAPHGARLARLRSRPRGPGGDPRRALAAGHDQHNGGHDRRAGHERRGRDRLAEEGRTERDREARVHERVGP